MFMINHKTPETASGFSAEFFKNFPEQLGVPAPLQVFTASPELFEKQMGVMGHFMGHEAIDFIVLAAIRYLISRHRGYDACIEFNGKMLMAAGVEVEELETMVEDPMQGPFEEKECLLIAFAYQSFLDPKSIGQAYLNRVLEAGWQESDLMDAVYQANFMYFIGNMVHTFAKKSTPHTANQ